MSNNICPACKKIYAEKPKRCICGWYLTNEKQAYINNFYCAFVEFGKQCQQPGVVAPSPTSKEWFCNLHDRRVREDRFKQIMKGKIDET